MGIFDKRSIILTGTNPKPTTPKPPHPGKEGRKIMLICERCKIMNMVIFSGWEGKREYKCVRCGCMHTVNLETGMYKKCNMV